MITKENLKEVLESLGFENKEEIYSKTINEYTLKINFKAKTLHYPKWVTIHDTTTSNFSHPENFVVFECVHRLLEKGYKAEHLELEPKWNLGRDKKGGKADILVRDNENNPYLIIECKTTDSKNSEFVKEWSRMQEDGGQLFSYLQQERSVKYLCLYTSDFNQNLLTYENYIINVSDNEATLKQTNMKGYKEALSNAELFRVWKNTYASDYQINGIFEQNIQAYKITQLKPTLDTLKTIDYAILQKKRHQWATILRASSVGDRGNALNKIMNLLLCKITDEVENQKGGFKDLQFSWGGFSADTPFDLVDRLQKLYQIGMKKYLKQEITYYSKDSIDKAFNSKYQDTPSRENIERIFNDLKYFQNGDFNFIEVYNHNLFNENFNILLQVVLMLEDIKFSDKDHSQFLGDFFENYIQDMPQHEGQYFTPVPLVNFIIYSLPLLTDNKVLDYACGAGHFLSEYAKINQGYRIKYQGVDKDPRLAKISAISSFMQGENIHIDYENSLKKEVIKNDSASVIIANPPYAVDGFLRVLNEEEREDYELFNKNISLDTNKIECFFIEKASKALESYGLLSLVLPNSILSNTNDSIYIKAREILLRDFIIVAICEFGNQTFFKTGTQPIILFAIRKPKDKNITTDVNIAQYFYKLIVENKTLNPYKDELEMLLCSYAAFMGYEYEMLEKLFFGTLENIEAINHENFKEYIKAYNEILEKEKKEYDKKSQKYKDNNPFSPLSLQDFIKRKEAEKFLYFCYTKDSNPLIIKAPKDDKGQKRFLGYFWSDKKGKEGIHYLMKSGMVENNINYINTPLFNPSNRFCTDTISLAILSHFIKYLDSKNIDKNFLQEFLKQEVNNENSEYLKSARLIDMIDFDKVEFNKAISLNPRNSNRSKESNPFANSKFELVKLGEIVNVVDYVANGSFAALRNNVKTTTDKGYAIFVRLTDYSNGWNGNYLYVNEKSFNFLKKSTLKPSDIVMCNVGSVGVCFIVPDLGQPMTLASNSILIQPIDENMLLKKYCFYIFQSTNFQKLLTTIVNTLSQPKFNKTNFKELKIPLPPLEIQKQIVAECEKVEEQYNTIRMSIEEYQKLIKAVLQKSGIIDENGGG